MNDALFHVKICGVTSADDARMIVESGADAIGLNFYPRSPRFVEDAIAERIIEAIPSTVCRVGVFVNEPAEEIRRRAERLNLNVIQLHGDEAPEDLEDLQGLKLIRAFRVGNSLDPIDEFLSRAIELSQDIAMLLVDGRLSGEYGGTGQTADWDLVAEHASHSAWPPLALAGGLTAENVAEAIRRVRPGAVDTASGVESSPGVKDPGQVKRFVQAARSALADR